jgi:CheY-like chemotaxis protein
VEQRTIDYRPDQARILVVDDNVPLLRTTTRMLVDAGFHVLTAEDGPQALRVLESGERIDILFTDLVLPGPLLGHQLATRAKAMRPGLKVLFTSGSASPTGDVQGLVNISEIDRLLSKPYLRRDLLARLQTLLAERPTRT